MFSGIGNPSRSALKAIEFTGARSDFFIGAFYGEPRPSMSTIKPVFAHVLMQELGIPKFNKIYFIFSCVLNS